MTKILDLITDWLGENWGWIALVGVFVDISPIKMTELILPSGAELGALGYSGLSLYEASSVLPSVMTASISPLKDVSDGLAHRALGVNVSMDTLSRLLKMSVTAFMTGGKK